MSYLVLKLFHKASNILYVISRKGRNGWLFFFPKNFYCITFFPFYFPKPSLYQSVQSQLSQLLHVAQIVQPLNHLHGPCEVAPVCPCLACVSPSLGTVSQPDLTSTESRRRITSLDVGNALPSRAQDHGGLFCYYLWPLSLMSSVSPRHSPILLLLFPVSPFSSVAFLLQRFFCFCISMEPPVQREMDKVYSSVDFGSSIVFRNHYVLLNQFFLPPALPGLEPGKGPTWSCVWQANTMPTEEEFYTKLTLPHNHV